MQWSLPILLFLALSAFALRGKSSMNPGENRPSFNADLLKKILVEKKSARFSLGFSKHGRPVEAFYFPGKSSMNALVIGGVHGSELSSIEVTRTLVQILEKKADLFYNVIVIPCLFPDNAELARKCREEIGSLKNVGRYTFNGATDPNRQMPSPGKSLDDENCLDHAGREIEIENLFLLQLINEYKPQRIASIHAIRNTQLAGFFADPRTDEQGMALGYDTDSSLAMSMADHVQKLKGRVPGNFREGKPTALYYLDPPPAEKGKFQVRNFKGSPMPGFKGTGISLGTWGATAVKDPLHPEYNRDAIRILTIEFPGSRRPIDYPDRLQQIQCLRQVQSIASAIKNIFLQEYFIEKSIADLNYY